MAVATTFSPTMAALTGNAGGVIQVLSNINLVGGKERIFHSDVTLASQALGTQIAIGRVPLNSAVNDVMLITDTSLGTSVISIGNALVATQYAPAATLTAINTPVYVAQTVSAGVPITTGYSSTTGLASSLHEDLMLYITVAALPAAGTLRIVIRYVFD